MCLGSIASAKESSQSSDTKVDVVFEGEEPDSGDARFSRTVRVRRARAERVDGGLWRRDSNVNVKDSLKFSSSGDSSDWDSSCLSLPRTVCDEEEEELRVPLRCCLMKICNCFLKYSFWASFSAFCFIKASNFSSKLKLELMVKGFFVAG